MSKCALEWSILDKMTTELSELLKGKYTSIDGLPYRQGAIGIVMDTDNNFLVVQMVSYKENQWRFPGGGVEENETAAQALLREFKEELGTDKFEILKESTQINRYDWPEFVIVDNINKKSRYFRGQEQTQFLVKFTGSKEDIKVDPVELRTIKWVPYNQLKKHFVFGNQWEIAEKVFKELLPTTKND